MTLDEKNKQCYNFCIKSDDRKEVGTTQALQRAVVRCETVSPVLLNTFRELLPENLKVGSVGYAR